MMKRATRKRKPASGDQGAEALTKPPARPDDRWAPCLEGVPFRPVFIMGDHRTGTTLLYQLLAQSGLFNYVTAYHVIRFDEILDHHFRGTEARARAELCNNFEQRGLTDRRLDRVTVSPDLPEEYGFLIEGDRFGRARLDTDSLSRVVELCRKINVIAGVERPVLLKNPWDYGNFMFVKAAFPDAKFIFIHRHPGRVIDSQLRAARSLYESRNDYLDLLASWYRNAYNRPFHRQLTRRLLGSSLGFQITFRHVRKVNSYFLANVGSLPPSDHVSVRYEDLCQDLQGNLDLILGHLGLEGAYRMDPRLKIHVRDEPLLPEVEAHLDPIREALGPYLERWRYLDE